MSTESTRHITVEQLARVEGEGALDIRIRGGHVEEVKLRIFEPPRLFEAFLRGRDYREVPDITARICGICPVAYQMSACHAMEQVCGVQIDGPIRDLRRLLYCGEWIESHALHIHLLHAPDFLGYPDALRMAQDHRPLVERGLRIKKMGNALVRLLGGREIHPINVRLGGFYRTRPGRSSTRAGMICIGRWMRPSPPSRISRRCASRISNRTMNSLPCGTRMNILSTQRGTVGVQQGD